MERHADGEYRVRGELQRFPDHQGNEVNDVEEDIGLKRCCEFRHGYDGRKACSELHCQGS